LDKGVLFAYRRECNCEKNKLFKLQALDSAAVYEMEIKGKGIIKKARGSELMNGLEVSIPETPGSRMIVYQKTRE